MPGAVFDLEVTVANQRTGKSAHATVDISAIAPTNWDFHKSWRINEICAGLQSEQRFGSKHGWSRWIKQSLKVSPKQLVPHIGHIGQVNQRWCQQVQTNNLFLCNWKLSCVIQYIHEPYTRAGHCWLFLVRRAKSAIPTWSQHLKFERQLIDIFWKMSGGLKPNVVNILAQSWRACCKSC